MPPELTGRAQTVKHLITLEVGRSKRERAREIEKERENRGNVGMGGRLVSDGTNSPSITNQSLLSPLPPPFLPFQYTSSQTLTVSL